MNKIIICTYDEMLIPEKQTSGSVCFDMKASDNFEINPGEIKLVGAGFKTYIPQKWHAKFYGRSSLPSKLNLMQANNIAVMDTDYRGEYLMQFYNFTKDTVSHPKYTRLCQLEFMYNGHEGRPPLKIPEIEFIVDKNLYDNFEKEFPSERGSSGIGSTGK